MQKEENVLNLMLFNVNIPKVSSIKFLGVTLDAAMSFVILTKEVRDKCSKRINILKIISHKSWKLDQKTLITIYYALVRSIMGAIIFPLVSNFYLSV
jgi:hypothetical protein